MVIDVLIKMRIISLCILISNITLYTLNSLHFIHQLYTDKAGKKLTKNLKNKVK